MNSSESLKMIAAAGDQVGPDVYYGLVHVTMRDSLPGRLKLFDGDVLLYSDAISIVSKFPRQATDLIGSYVIEKIGDCNLLLHVKSQPNRKGDPYNITTVWSQFLDWLLFALWLVRDHSISLSMPVIRTEQMVGSTALTTSYSLCDGSVADTEFSVSEIKATRDLLQDTIMSLGGERPIALPVWTDTSISSKEVTPLWRCYHFLRAARTNPDLAVKIANYMTCFETLFSTDNTELSHKLSERVAFFLCDSDRKTAYGKMKRAYGVRSRVVHGGSLSARGEASLAEVSSDVDGLLRASLRKILYSDELLEVFQGEAQNRDAYLTDLVLA